MYPLTQLVKSRYALLQNQIKKESFWIRILKIYPMIYLLFQKFS